MPKAQPVDPAAPGRQIVSGRVVTMDQPAHSHVNARVIPDGRVCIGDGVIVAVLEAGDAPPAGFDGHTPTLMTGGSIYPGLIELHNHLSYNALRLWQVPKAYTNRDQWAGIPQYRDLISGPMKVIGAHTELLPALVRYVEVKCLVAGTTTTQGIALFSAPGIPRYYRGLVRNVEQTSEDALPQAVDRIPDVEATKIDSFENRLQHQTSKHACLLLHLSEGIDPSARKHFLALKDPKGQWAITSSLAGIHCVALNDQDISVLAAQGGAMVWSPLSNLLLYGQTARVEQLKAAQIRIGLGPDWSPSGSKNLLGELKVAHLYSAHTHAPPLFSDEELIGMATREAAAILGWQDELGSIEPNKKADLIVIDGVDGDPYTALINATERNISLVMIEGVARYGTRSAMDSLGITGEHATIAGSERVLNAAQKSSDPDVASVTLAAATETLTHALATLPQLAASKPALAAAAPGIRLALDEIEDTGMQLRPRLPIAGEPTGPSPQPLIAATPPVLVPLTLDPLTIPDDPDYLTTLKAAKNLPAYVQEGLATYY